MVVYNLNKGENTVKNFEKVKEELDNKIIQQKLLVLSTMVVWT